MYSGGGNIQMLSPLLNYANKRLVICICSSSSLLRQHRNFASWTNHASLPFTLLRRSSSLWYDSCFPQSRVSGAEIKKCSPLNRLFFLGQRRVVQASLLGLASLHVTQVTHVQARVKLFRGNEMRKRMRAGGSVPLYTRLVKGGHR